MGLHTIRNIEATRNINPEKIQTNTKLPSINSSKTNLYNGLNLPLAPDSLKKPGFERFKVYERQQKAFDIINCHPRKQEFNKLRNYPKLTLEDRLIERGTYHAFNE